MTLNEEITLVCAFRYALGRMTYVVDSVASEMERRIEDISLNQLVLFRTEIALAIKEERAGSQMDLDRWNKCRESISSEIARRSV